MLHAAAGRAFEHLYADRLEDAYDRLAYHYARTDEHDKAFTYLVRFAENAARKYAHEDALSALREALRHLDGVPAQDRDRAWLETALRLAHSLYFLGRFPETLRLLDDGRERLERVDDAGLSGPYYFWRTTCSPGRRGGRAKTYGVSNTAVRLLRSSSRRGSNGGWRSRTVLRASITVGWASSSRRFRWATRAYAIGESIGDARIQSYALWNRGWYQAASGAAAAGIAACQQSLQQSPDPFNTTAATGWLGYAYLEARQPELAVP